MILKMNRQNKQHNQYLTGARADLYIPFCLALFYLFALSGCLGEGFEVETDIEDAPITDVSPIPPCDVAALTCTLTAEADKVATEVQNFEFDFNTSITSPTYFYLENAPTWLNVDEAGTRIYGIPTSTTTVSDLKIHIYDGTETEVIGPFDITITGDPLARFAWHLNNTGQKSFSSNAGTAGEDIDLINVMADGYTGSGVTILVSDTGVEIAHEDLDDNVIAGQSRNYNIASPWIGNPTPADGTLGHGTAVAGLIAAIGWNSIGSRGVAPEATFAGTNFLDSDGDIAKYIDQASNDFDIYNYSYGYANCAITPSDDTFIAALKSGVETQRAGKGSIYIKAAGNDYIGDLSSCAAIPSDTLYYAGNSNFDQDNTSPYMITVGAVNAAGSASSYSVAGSNLWIVSPGGQFGGSSPAMITTDMEGCTDGLSESSNSTNSFDDGTSSFNTLCNYTSTMNGTSSAAPVTAGVVALMLEARPALTWRDVKYVLATTATVIKPNSGSTSHPLGSDYGKSGITYQRGWVTNNAGIKFHNRYGFGRINAEDAVAAAITHTLLPTFIETESPVDDTWYYNSGTLNQNIPDNSSTGTSDTISVLHNLKIEAVQIKVNITQQTGTNEYISDLGIEITSPAGTKSIVMNINSIAMGNDLVDTLFLSNAFLNESSYGSWQIKVYDAAGSDTGRLEDWSIKIFGHVDPSRADQSAPSQPASVTAPASYNSLTDTPTVTWAAADPSDVMRFEVSVGTTSGNDNVVPWHSVGTVTSISLGDLTLTDGNTYYFNVRTVDGSENASSSTSDSWVADVP